MDAAESIDLEFGLLCYTLLYTGRRIGDLLNDNTKLRNLNPKRATLYLGDTKNGEAVTVHLPPIVIESSRRCRRASWPVVPAASARFSCVLPYATWMLPLVGDNYGLARAGRWKDSRSAEGYLHTLVSSEAKRADLLPTSNGAKGVQRA